jgi:uncharacterized protein (DUF1810 family)
MNDSFDLRRFVEAQEPVYRQVVEELSHGRKRNHWMWFVFPQITGFAFSAMAQRSRSAPVQKLSLTFPTTCSGPV